MLEKPLKIEINNDNIFLNDKMNREVTVKLFTNLISTLNQPFTICLDAPWGGGKTTFIEMWSKYLEKENFITLHFNAWENDFTNEPFISLVSEIGEQLSTKNPEEISTFDKQKKTIFEKGGELVKKTIPLAVKLATLNTLEIDDLKDIIEKGETKAISDFLSKTAEEQISNYGENKNIRESFKKSLSIFAEDVIADGSKKSPIVIFIDELDRCNPLYAIKLLENIKHIFNLDNFVFILSMDKTQLKHSIKAHYGDGLNTDGYLKKFIDIDLRLPFIANIPYLNNLLNNTFNIKSINNRNYSDDNYIELFKMMIDIHSLSLRDIEHISSELNLIVRATFDDNSREYIYLSLLIFLLVTKHTNINLFNQLKTRKISADDFIDEIEKIHNDYEKIRKEYYFLYAFLLSANLDDNGFEKLLRNLNETRREYNKSFWKFNYIEKYKKTIYNIKNILNDQSNWGDSICKSMYSRYIKKIDLIT